MNTMTRLLRVVAAAGVLLISCAASDVTLDQLQGAWWSDPSAPTADFGIHGDQVWLDSDSAYHPCRIEEGVLIFELPPDLGQVRNSIVRHDGDRLVLRNEGTGQTTTLTRRMD